MKSIYPIVGMKYVNAESFVRGLMRLGAETTVVTLEREPDNLHDPNAIKVIANDRHIGYVPKDFAARLAREMDARYLKRRHGWLFDNRGQPAVTLDE